MPQHNVLFIEDVHDDILLVERAMKKAGVQCSMTILRDGDEAVEYLKNLESTATERQLPDLILLDLKLPRRSGFEVLEWIRQHHDFRRIPVVVLTSSKDRDDISKAYDLGANSYLVKPIIPQDMQSLCRVLGLYWLETNYPYPFKNETVEN